MATDGPSLLVFTGAVPGRKKLGVGTKPSGGSVGTQHVKPPSDLPVANPFLFPGPSPPPDMPQKCNASGASGDSAGNAPQVGLRPFSFGGCRTGHGGFNSPVVRGTTGLVGNGIQQTVCVLCYRWDSCISVILDLFCSFCFFQVFAMFNVENCAPTWQTWSILVLYNFS